MIAIPWSCTAPFIRAVIRFRCHCQAGTGRPHQRSVGLRPLRAPAPTASRSSPTTVSIRRRSLASRSGASPPTAGRCSTTICRTDPDRIHTMSVIEGQVLWTPSEETRAAAQLTRFTDWLEAEAGLQFADYRELHAWSVEQPQEFWSAVWRFFDICSDTPYEAVVGELLMPGAQWFKGARVNYAEHVLRGGEARGKAPAILSLSEIRPLETMTWDKMSARVRRLAPSMRAPGGRSGDSG